MSKEYSLWYKGKIVMAHLSLDELSKLLRHMGVPFYTYIEPYTISVVLLDNNYTITKGG
jgi:hypothetical protein